MSRKTIEFCAMGAIADSQITASSEWGVNCSPKQARLHTKSNGCSCWASLKNDLNQWLQVDFGKITPVTHVATQGKNTLSHRQWVKKYKLQFSDDGASFLFYKRQGESSDAVNRTIIRTATSTLYENTFGSLSADIICFEKRTVFWRTECLKTNVRGYF